MPSGSSRRSPDTIRLSTGTSGADSIRKLFAVIPLLIVTTRIKLREMIFEGGDDTTLLSKGGSGMGIAAAFPGPNVEVLPVAKGRMRPLTLKVYEPIAADLGSMPPMRSNRWRPSGMPCIRCRPSQIAHLPISAAFTGRADRQAQVEKKSLFLLDGSPCLRTSLEIDASPLHVAYPQIMDSAWCRLSTCPVKHLASESRRSLQGCPGPAGGRLLMRSGSGSGR